jgi:branched-subunit amino acid aminotransferase/4-amino-4-deoxychorismate lyase
VLVWLNGELLDEAEARLSALSAGILYGWGVFTTLGIRNGVPLAASLHWQRLLNHAERTHIPLTIEEEAARRGLEELIREQEIVEGRARITVARSSGGLWRPALVPGSDLIITAMSMEPRDKPSVALTVSPFRVLSSSPLAGIKSTAYLANLLALQDARTRGFDDAVLLNERGEVVEASAANLFWVRSRELITPALATGALAGVTRRLVVEAARGLRIRVSEGSFAVSELRAADEVFLTNSTHGITDVSEIDMHRYASPAMSVRLREALDKTLSGLP